QGRLAAAGAADDHRDLARLDVERDVVHRAHAVGIGLPYMVENKHRGLYLLAPKASSQRRNGAAAMTMIQSESLPMIANATMPATISAGLPSCWPSISR